MSVMVGVGVARELATEVDRVSIVVAGVMIVVLFELSVSELLVDFKMAKHFSSSSKVASLVISIHFPGVLLVSKSWSFLPSLFVINN